MKRLTLVLEELDKQMQPKESSREELALEIEGPERVLLETLRDKLGL